MAKGSGGTASFDHSKGHAAEKLSNNVASSAPRAVTLRCGHEARGHPLARRANGKDLFVCPEGDGLQEIKR